MLILSLPVLLSQCLTYCISMYFLNKLKEFEQICFTYHKLIGIQKLNGTVM